MKICLLMFSLLFIGHGICHAQLNEKSLPPNMVMYYFVNLKINPQAPDYSHERLAEIQAAHMKNIGQMIKDKKLLLAGPFAKGGGLFILKVNSMEEAQALVSQDPAVKAQRFVPEISEWITEKGVFTLENY